MTIARVQVRVACIAMLVGVGGCGRGLPFQTDPYTTPTTIRDSVVTSAADIREINGFLAHQISTIGDERERDKFIALKMYLIDRQYFEYERQLTNEDTSINTLGSIGTLASTAVAAAIPAGQTTKALAAVATGLNGATSIYDEKALLTKSVQSLQIEMRADRDLAAAQIYSRMQCSIYSYTVGMALSDLEAYARAGTFEAALQGLSKTVSQAQSTASDTKKAALSGAFTSTNLTRQVDKLVHTVQNTAPCPLVLSGPTRP